MFHVIDRYPKGGEGDAPHGPPSIHVLEYVKQKRSNSATCQDQPSVVHSASLSIRSLFLILWILVLGGIFIIKYRP